jgi:hypothetical protein
VFFICSPLLPWVGMHTRVHPCILLLDGGIMRQVSRPELCGIEMHSQANTSLIVKIAVLGSQLQLALRLSRNWCRPVPIN